MKLQLARRALSLAVAPLLLPALPPPLLAAEPRPDPSSGVITPSGLKFIDFRKGNGASPRFGQLIKFHYVAYAVGGEKKTLFPWESGEKQALTQFDSTYERDGGIPYFTKHGNGFTCQGIEEALHTMKPGGRRRIVLPATLGFEIGDKGPLPPGPRQRETLFAAIEKREPLVYDLELISAVDDLLDRGDYDELTMEEANAFAKTLLPPEPPDGDGPMGKGL